MKKPKWLLIGITFIFMCLLLGIFLSRASTHNQIPINNAIPPKYQNDLQDTPSSDGKVNINTATIQQLILLPGVGETIANNIIEYRRQNGDFKDIKDIINVSGIGEKKFKQMEPYIKIE